MSFFVISPLREHQTGLRAHWESPSHRFNSNSQQGLLTSHHRPLPCSCHIHSLKAISSHRLEKALDTSSLQWIQGFALSVKKWNEKKKKNNLKINLSVEVKCLKPILFRLEKIKCFTFQAKVTINRWYHWRESIKCQQHLARNCSRQGGRNISVTFEGFRKGASNIMKKKEVNVCGCFKCTSCFLSCFLLCHKSENIVRGMACCAHLYFYCILTSEAATLTHSTAKSQAGACPPPHYFTTRGKVTDSTYLVSQVTGKNSHFQFLVAWCPHIGSRPMHLVTHGLSYFG